MIVPFRRALASAALVTLIQLAPAAFSAEAQLTRGAMVGTVTDTTGAALPGVAVTVTNLATDVARVTTTNEAGFYRAGGLEPGVYAVLVHLDGFRPVENTDLRVQPGQETTFNVSLGLGGLEETIDVTAETTAATLNRTNPTIGATFTERQATELPLSATRNINNMALLLPNTAAGPGSSGISANGQRARNNNFMIDGSDNNDASVTISTIGIVPEAVAQFQVQTNPYNAEFGRNSGGQINVITRSGTNQFTGEAWNYYRGSALNSRTNIEKDSGLDRPARSNGNQFGGSLGGPIAPGRTFFFGLYQADLLRRGALLGPSVRVPTPAGLTALQNVPLRAGQPAASRQAVLGALGFLNDVHAQNPVFRTIQNVTVNGVPIETGLISMPRRAPIDSHNFLTRIDHRLSINSTLTGRYILDQAVADNLTSNTQFGDRFTAQQDIRDQNLGISETRVIGSQTLNEFRFAYIRRNLQFPENEPGMPTTGIGGAFTIGGLSNFPQGRVQNSYQFFNILSRQTGRHSLKFGADIRYVQLDNQAAFNSKGTFSFNNLQDFMNNQASTFTQALQVASFDARQWNQFYFVQNDFRATPNLTLNLGLRYELSSTPFGFFGATEPEVQATRVPGPVTRDTNNFAPRLGFAWSPEGRSGLSRLIFGEDSGVLRGGYGITYDVLFFNILTVNASNFPRVVTGVVNNAIDVFPNLAPVEAQPVFNPLALFVNTPEDAENPLTHIYSLTLQRELARNYVLEVGYTGSLGRNGINQLQANAPILTEAQAALVRQTQNAFAIPSAQARREDPTIGSRILIATTAKSQYDAVFVALNKRFSRGLQFGGSYTYGALFSDNDESLGVGAITAGSPQVPQDFNDIDAEWSRSAFDRPHRVTVNWVYELPRLTGQPAVVRQILGGWQFTGTYQAQSGQPFTILTGVDSNGNGAGGDRPNFNAGGTLTPDPVTGNLRTFTTENMFLVPRGTNGLPLANSLGNGSLGRNTLRGPGFQQWNFSLAKRVALPSDHSIRFRADFINAFNQPSYGNPVSNMNSPNFGQNLNNWGNRAITLSAKYSF
jgi:hypothetical protein